MNNNYSQVAREFEEVVIQINRVSKKTAGGNQMRFAALVVAGDGKGKVGLGLGKAPDVVNAIRKATESAKKHAIKVPLVGTTVPCSEMVKLGAAKVLIKPAPAGSGIIAGGPLRVVFKVAGIRDVVGKILGTNNKISNVYAIMKALENIAKLVRNKREVQNKHVATA
ncbi:30S ribosomal protein S5 [Candidatus Microgenomates bacterium]|nr:30S ribosomal protein S5 [Candidatus Microgenomates bacterium]